MSISTLDTSALPASRRIAFQRFAEALGTVFAEDLLGLTAFGGWVVEDPLYQESPARSVAVLRRVDLKVLDRLSAEGVHFGKQGIAAPLVMTPEYITASRDAYPLELIEIQELNAHVGGSELFRDLTFDPQDIRLQCERELKSELIQLRQGLLRSAGNRRELRGLCLACAERTVRILRGLLRLKGKGEVQRFAKNVITRAAAVSGLKLDALHQAVAAPADVDFAAFERFYREVESLAAHVDGLS